MITDLQLRLFGEGNHKKIDDKRGAHLTAVEIHAVTRCAVRAPDTKRFSVLVFLLSGQQ